MRRRVPTATKRKNRRLIMTKVDEELNALDDRYSAKDMAVLEGLEPVRKRPGMYIGSTGPYRAAPPGWEVVDNSVDEAMAGYCTGST